MNLVERVAHRHLRTATIYLDEEQKDIPQKIEKGIKDIGHALEIAKKAESEIGKFEHEAKALHDEAAKGLQALHAAVAAVPHKEAGNVAAEIDKDIQAILGQPWTAALGTESGFTQFVIKTFDKIRKTFMRIKSKAEVQNVAQVFNSQVGPVHKKLNDLHKKFDQEFEGYRNTVKDAVEYNEILENHGHETPANEEYNHYHWEVKHLADYWLIKPSEIHQNVKGVVNGLSEMHKQLMNLKQQHHAKQASLVDRVVARFLQADQNQVALTFPREFHLPPHVRPTPAHVPEGTDLAVWTWDEEKQTPTGPQMRYYGIAFAGKSNKPLWHYSFKSPESRQKQIDETVRSRKSLIDYKTKKLQERRDFVHNIQKGEIFSTSWGYDQTNVDFYEVVEVKGKMVAVREIALKVVKEDRGSDLVMPVPGHYVGPAKLVKPSTGGGFKVDDHYASKWNGKPEHQTPFGMGH